jgi:hypothetical protein
MSEVKVSDYERRKPSGGKTHVRSYMRHQEGASSPSPGESNFEDEEQEEKEEKYDVEATVTGEMDDNGNLENTEVKEVRVKPKDREKEE